MPSWLPKDAKAVVADAVEAIARGAGEKLKSVLLVGAAVDPARHSGHHAPELLVVLSDLPVASLTNIAHQLAESVGEGVRLRLFTEGELMRSADVFTLELAEYRDRNEVLQGADPFTSLHFTPGELRRSIEQSLRRLSRDIRHAVVRAACAHDDAPTQRAFIEGIDHLVVPAHHLLALLDETVPTEEIALIEAVAKKSGTNPRPLRYWVEKARSEGRVDHPVEALGELVEVVDAVTKLVDITGV